MHQVRLANTKSFSVSAGMSILDGASQAGIVLEHSCRTGRCGTCKARLLKGRVAELRPDLCLSGDERKAGWTLTCVNGPSSDVEIDIEDLGLPADLKARTVPCRIDALDRPAPDVIIARLRFPPTAGFRYLAGQYVEVIGKGGLRRSYSIANVSDASSKVELHIRRVEGGLMSDYWFELAHVGDLLRMHGPLGTFFLRDIAGMHLALLATGTGIAPVRAMLGALAASPPEARPRSLSLLWGNRVPSDVYWNPRELLPECSPETSFSAVLSRADPSWAGARGHVQDILLQQAPPWAETAVYACGSAAMIASSRAALGQAGLPMRRFFSDAFVSSQ